MAGNGLLKWSTFTHKNWNSRLSYYERVVDLIPKSLERLLPPPCEPCYKFDKNTGMNQLGFAQALLLQTAFREKASIEQILDILKQVPNPLDMECEMDSKWPHNPLAISVFSQTLFMLGSKTISHSRSAILNHQQVFEVSYVKCMLSKLLVPVTKMWHPYRQFWKTRQRKANSAFWRQRLKFGEKTLRCWELSLICFSSTRLSLSDLWPIGFLQRTCTLNL